MASQFDTLFEQAASPIINVVFGVPATLTRAGLTTAAPFTVTFEERVYELSDEGGQATSFVGRAYSMLRSDYKTTGSVLTPQRADKLNVLGEVWQLFETDKKPCYELLGGDYRWLVHTKKVA